VKTYVWQQLFMYGADDYKATVQVCKAVASHLYQTAFKLEKTFIDIQKHFQGAELERRFTARYKELASLVRELVNTVFLCAVRLPQSACVSAIHFMDCVI
jgi:hypothetical protein